MRLSKLRICGFRNFVDETIVFDGTTLIIGANDSGKTNLLYALRLILDPTLSPRNFELDDADFNIQTRSNEVVITAYFTEVTEDCLIATFGGKIDAEDRLVIQFRCEKNGEYSFYVGGDEDHLEESSSRFYIKVLSLEYVSGARDYARYMSKQQSKLLQLAKDRIEANALEKDEASIDQMQESLEQLNDEIGRLNYISEALDKVNEEMAKLSVSGDDYEAKFVAGNTDINKLLDNLTLSYFSNETPLTFGGDGRGNQLYFAAWIAEGALAAVPSKVVIYAIEEPEAHLHPHQQRRLARYLASLSNEQVILTSHSPQIAEKFVAGHIVRLFAKTDNTTHAAFTNQKVAAALNRFSYRMNPISAEILFSSGAVLVEGPSEKMLYTKLGDLIFDDLDRANISILSVDGVGFKPYLALCQALSIPCVMRTDNDVFSDRKGGFRKAGLKRAVECANIMSSDSFNVQDGELYLTESPIPEETPPEITEKLNEVGVFLSRYDLETDLVNGPLRSDLGNYYGIADSEKIIAAMQERKAENMFSFLTSAEVDLSPLAEDGISKPLHALKELIDVKKS